MGNTILRMMTAHASPAAKCRVMSLRAVVAALGLACAGCANNEFLLSYQGTRYPASPATAVVDAKPAGSGLIGTSSFTSAGTFGAPEAVAAGRDVGADSVRWWRAVASGAGVTGQGTLSGGLSATGPVSSWSPTQPGPLLFTYQARFYRAGVADQMPAIDPQDRTPGAAPAPAHSGGAQAEQDSTAATQEQAQRQREAQAPR